MSDVKEKVEQVTLPLCIDLLESRYGKAIKSDVPWIQRLLYAEFDIVATDYDVRDALGLVTVDEEEARVMYKQVT